MATTNKARAAQARRSSGQRPSDSGGQIAGGLTRGETRTANVIGEAGIGTGAGASTALEEVQFNPAEMRLAFALRQFSETCANLSNQMRSALRDYVVQTHDLPASRGEWEINRHYSGLIPPTTKAGSR